MGKSIKILVVDDNSDHRQLMKKCLEDSEFNFQVECAGSGNDCMAMIASEDYSLAIIDYQMPGMNGLEVIIMINRDGRDLPLIMVTGMGDEKVAVTAMKAGAYDYVVKSANFVITLPYVIKNALNRYNLTAVQNKLLDNLKESEERYRALFEGAAEGILVADPGKGDIKYANPAICKMMGYTEEEIKQVNLSGIYPEDGQDLIISEFAVPGKRKKNLALRIACIRKDNRIIYADINMTRILIQEKEYAVGFFTDVTEIKKAEDALLYRSRILGAVSSTAEQFLRQEPLKEVNIQVILEQLGEATNVSRACIYENYSDKKGNHLTRLGYEWIADHTTQQADNIPDKSFLWDTGGMERWENTLKQNKLIMGTVKEFPPGEQEFLIDRNIKSIVVVPVFVRRNWWGYICFCECRHARVWNFEEIEALKISGAMLGALIGRNQLEMEIKASLGEKEILLQEIHHRVKNNLQIIISLIDMCILRINDTEVNDLLTDVSNKIHIMALIHTQIYQSKRFDKIEMKNQVQEIFNLLLGIYSKESFINSTIKVSKIYLSLNQAIPCALVLTELISNVFKHAYKGEKKGTVDISMKKTAKDMILVKIKDYGIGLPEKFDINKINSFGLKLVRNIVQKQLNGEIKVNRTKGTEFIIRFQIIKTGTKHAQSNDS